MTRINAIRNTAETNSVAWGKKHQREHQRFRFRRRPDHLLRNRRLFQRQTETRQLQQPDSRHAADANSGRLDARARHAGRDQAGSEESRSHKKPATVNYTDKTYGVTFEYPRRYAIETGDAAAELLLSNPIPMNFVQPGGVALAAVELPETNFVNTDFSSAFFNVSVNKNSHRRSMHRVRRAAAKSVAMPADEPVQPVRSRTVTCERQRPNRRRKAGHCAAPKSDSTSATAQPCQHGPASAVKPSTQSSTDSASNSKLMLGDLELRATEAVSGEGTRQSDSKYFHVFQNGACYEFALNVTTVRLRRWPRSSTSTATKSSTAWNKSSRP